MDFELPAADDPRRLEVRAWLAAHPSPSGQDLAEAGYVAPHWPEPWGLDADPILQIIIDDELKAAGVRRPSNQIGIGWAGPTIVHAGTPEQQARYLPKILSGEEIWCQLFSEPEAGSEMAALGTRAAARDDAAVADSSARRSRTSRQRPPSLAPCSARTETEVPKDQGEYPLLSALWRTHRRWRSNERRADRLPHLQRGVPHRRAPARREPGG